MSNSNQNVETTCNVENLKNVETKMFKFKLTGFRYIFTTENPVKDHKCMQQRQFKIKKTSAYL